MTFAIFWFNIVLKYNNYRIIVKLPYNNKWIKQDYTIILENEEEYYWECLGTIEIESYDNRWLGKHEIYDKYFIIGKVKVPISKIYKGICN